MPGTKEGVVSKRKESLIKEERRGRDKKTRNDRNEEEGRGRTRGEGRDRIEWTEKKHVRREEEKKTKGNKVYIRVCDTSLRPSDCCSLHLPEAVTCLMPGAWTRSASLLLAEKKRENMYVKITLFSSHFCSYFVDQLFSR